MTGNADTQTVERRELEPIVVARRVRFVPFSQHPRTVCMRVELYGCTSKGQCPFLTTDDDDDDDDDDCDSDDSCGSDSNGMIMMMVMKKMTTIYAWSE